MRTHTRSIPTLFLALSLFPVHSFAADREARFTDAKSTFRAAREGDASKAPRANELLQALAAESPNDPVILAYAGSAATVVGRDAASPIDALKRTESGLDQLDLALRKLGPEHDALHPGAMPVRLEVLLVAASTFVQIPDGVFHRRQDGKAAIAAAVSHPLYPRMPSSVHAQFEWLRALVSRDENDAAGERAALEKVLSLDPSGALAPKARARLAELSR